VTIGLGLAAHIESDRERIDDANVVMEFPAPVDRGGLGGLPFF
jgi:hypothetical protein